MEQPQDATGLLREDHRTVVGLNEEEAELFPLLTEHLGHDALDALGTRLAAAKALAPTRPHPNAPNRPPFNVLAGAGAAIVDRARDAITGRGDADRK